MSKGWYCSVLFLEGGEVIVNGRSIGAQPREVNTDVEVVFMAEQFNFVKIKI